MPKRKLTPTERALWDKVVADVTPHKSGAKQADLSAPDPQSGARMAGRNAAGSPPPSSASAPPDASDLGDMLDAPPPRDDDIAESQKEQVWFSREQAKSKRSDHQPGAMDRRTLQKLRQGRVMIDGKIDLHGMRQEEAHQKLCRFIDMCHHAGKRMVLVITGRGSRDDGVLKRMAPRWLSSAPISRHVISVSSAHAMHGGVGALYVQLRRPHR